MVIVSVLILFYFVLDIRYLIPPQSFKVYANALRVCVYRNSCTFTAEHSEEAQ